MNTLRVDRHIVNGFGVPTRINHPSDSFSGSTGATSPSAFCETRVPYEAAQAIVTATMENHTHIRRSYLQRLITATGEDRENVQQRLERLADDWGIELC